MTERLDVSIVVPTYQRHEYVARMLRFHAIDGYTGTLLIGDASDDAGAAATRAVIDEVADAPMTVRYHHWPGLALHPTMQRLTEAIETAYVTYAGDDDLHVQAGVQAVVAFLERRPDHAAAIGRGCYFELSGDRPTRAGGFWTAAATQATAAARLEQLLSHYWPVIYAIQRTPSWQAAWRQDGNPDQWFRDELPASTLPVIHGKLGRVPDLQLFRQTHVDAGSGRLSGLRWLTSAGFAPGFQQFEALLLAEAEASGEEPSAVGEALYRGLTHYLTPRPRQVWARKLRALYARSQAWSDALIGRDAAILRAITAAARPGQG